MIFYTTLFAKHDFTTGAINLFEIQRAPLNSGWVVLLKGRIVVGYLTTARKLNEPRIFKTLDAAVIALEEIGFSVLKLS